MNPTLKFLRVLLAALAALGVLLGIGNFLIKAWYVGFQDLLGAVCWFVFYSIVTYIQYRREAENPRFQYP